MRPWRRSSSTAPGPVWGGWRSAPRGAARRSAPPWRTPETASTGRPWWGSGGALSLGVLEPEGTGRLGLLRRPYSRDIQALGPPVRGEAHCSFSFQKDPWQAAEHPGLLFESPFLRTRLEGVPRAWRREREGLLLLAIPLEEGGPFPLEALFCLARVERGGGGSCAQCSPSGGRSRKRLSCRGGRFCR